MRLSLLLLAPAALIAGSAFAQTAPQPSVDGYLCVYAGKCDGADDAGEATMAAPEGKGFRIARSKNAQTAQPPASTTAPPTARRARAVAPPARAASAVGMGKPRSDLMIGFALGSDRMTADGVAKARIFATALLRPELRDRRFVIEGHTDSRGTATANRALSQRRAESVAAFLAAQGVDRGRLDVRGMGFDAPLPGHAASNPLNRRVEAELIS